MAHILLGGDLRNGPAVRSLLREWGMTCSLWSSEDPGFALPSIDECDATILILPSDAAPSSPSGGPAAAPPAPLILLGEYPGPLLLARDAWRVVNDPGPEGVDLKFAVQSALEQSQRLRGHHLPLARPNPKVDQEGYLQFLSHELRSPLTAAKTALEVLQGELGGLLGPGENQPRESGSKGNSQGDARLAMVDIALRNIKRLHRTVDWNQDLQELEKSVLSGQWSRVLVEELGMVAAETMDLVIEEGARGLELESDRNLLRVLMGQMTRVLDYALPGCPLRGVVRVDSARSRCLELAMQPQNAGPLPDEPRIMRTRLARATGQQESSPQEELERLVGYVVSRPLLDRLHARVLVCQDAEGIPGLVLRLVLSADGPSDGRLAEDPLAVLHAPA